MNPGFLELCPMGWFFGVARFRKLGLKLAFITSVSHRGFGVWQKNAFPTAVSIDLAGVCCYLGVTAAPHRSSALQWMGNALKGKGGSYFCCVLCRCPWPCNGEPAVSAQVSFSTVQSQVWESCWKRNSPAMDLKSNCADGMVGGVKAALELAVGAGTPGLSPQPRWNHHLASFGLALCCTWGCAWLSKYQVVLTWLLQFAVL